MASSASIQRLDTRISNLSRRLTPIREDIKGIQGDIKDIYMQLGIINGKLDITNQLLMLLIKDRGIDASSITGLPAQGGSVPAKH